MQTATVTREGQVTIPKTIREQLHLKAGDRLGFILADDGRVFIKATLAVNPPSSDIRKLRGLLYRPGQRTMTVEEMDEAIGRHLADKADRIRRGH